MHVMEVLQSRHRAHHGCTCRTPVVQEGESACLMCGREGLRVSTPNWVTLYREAVREVYANYRPQPTTVYREAVREEMREVFEDNINVYAGGGDTWTRA